MDAPRSANPVWSADVLAGFSATPLVNGVLVRQDHQPAEPRAAMVHLHGYNDYFFQVEFAHDMAQAGLAFYACDLNGAGRAISGAPIPHFMTDIAQPGDGIEEAVAAVAALHPGIPVLVHAHSTGGLSACIWAADRPHPALVGLILDSPLFGRRERGVKHYGRVLLPVIGRARPHLQVSSRPSVYAQHLHASSGGRWQFDTTLKRPEGVPARAAWALAVRRAQQRIARGLNLDVPVLVARSAQTGPESAANPLLDSQDIVVDVQAIARLAPRLGPRVEELIIDGGIHELSLSAPAPRAAYIRGLIDWINRVLA